MNNTDVNADQLRKQTQKIHLVIDMAKIAYDKDALASMIDQHRDEIDYNFLMLITMTIQQAAQTHDEATVDRYGRLREQITKQLDLKAEDLPSLGVENQIDELIDTLLATPPTMLQGAVATNRPLIDYNFLIHLSQRAEQSQNIREKEQLFALHAKLLEITDKMDRLAQQAMERATSQLNEVLQAEDVEAKLQELGPNLDEGFLVVLSANLEHAKAQGHQQIVQSLMRIYAYVVHMMESRLRPELQAMNDLLRLNSPQERHARLRQELQIYNPAGFIEMIETIAADLEESGQAQDEILERLYTIADEARDVLSTMDDAFFAPTQKLFS